MLSQCTNEIAWFLQETYQRQDDSDVSLWNTWPTQVSEPQTLFTANQKLAWTIVGEPSVVYAITGLFEQLPSEDIQTTTESNPITDWVTFTYVPLSKLKEVTIQTPVTLCIEKRIPSQVRELFTKQVVHSIISTEPIKLPASLQNIHTMLHPNWSFDALLQPIHKTASTQQVKPITLLDSFIIEIKNQQWQTQAAYQELIDQIVADSLNRYWLTNNPAMTTWLVPTISSIKTLRDKVNYYEGDCHPASVIEELQQWVQQLAN